MTMQLSDLGQIVATPAAIAAFDATNEVPMTYLVRHLRADWGELSDHDRKANDRALIDGSRILSAYQLRDQTNIWIITEAVGDDGKRASTCVLMPDEY